MDNIKNNPIRELSLNEVAAVAGAGGTDAAYDAGAALGGAVGSAIRSGWSSFQAWGWSYVYCI